MRTKNGKFIFKTMTIFHLFMFTLIYIFNLSINGFELINFLLYLGGLILLEIFIFGFSVIVEDTFWKGKERKNERETIQ